MPDRKTTAKTAAATLRGAWWEIRPRAAAQGEERVTELFIYGDIGESWFGDSVTAADLARELAAVDADRIVARINSYGGSVTDGLAIYNALRRHPAEVTTAIDGVALSIASLIAMAGDRVEMADNARLMIHAPWGAMIGNAKDAREFADLLDGFSNSMASSYARKTGRPVEDMAALLLDGEDHWYSAAEAQAEGFVDDITDALAIAAALPDRFRPGARTQAPTPVLPTAQETPPMPTPRTPADPAAPTNVVDIEAARTQAAEQARTEALAAERTRREAIRAAFRPFLARHEGVPALLDAVLDDPAVTEEAARARLLAKLGEGVEPVNGAGAITIGVDQRDRHIAAGRDALLARMGRAKADGSNPFRGLSLKELARECLAQAGLNVRGMTPEEYAPLALSRGVIHGLQTTSDLPVILENVMHKLMLDGFLAQPTTYQEWVRIGDVSDLRAWKRLVPGLLGNLDTVNEAGEYKDKIIPDAEANSITAVRRGNIISITPEVLINDDIGYVQTLADGLGRVGARAIERAVYALLESNPALSDGVALFHSTHGNLAGSGAAPTVTLIDAAAAAMALQTAPGDDAEYLDIRPNVALANRAREGELRVLIDAQYDPDTANKLQRPNMVKGIVGKIITTPRLAAAPWYLFADPNVAPVIEVAFLNGQREPRLAQEEAFRSGGISWRVELPFGVGAIDYRGAYKNPGA